MLQKGGIGWRWVYVGVGGVGVYVLQVMRRNLDGWVVRLLFTFHAHVRVLPLGVEGK